MKYLQNNYNIDYINTHSSAVISKQNFFLGLALLSGFIYFIY